jgi:hypothetical protein
MWFQFRRQRKVLELLGADMYRLRLLERTHYRLALRWALLAKAMQLES